MHLDRRAIGTQQRLLIHADRRRINHRIGVLRRSKKKNPSAGTSRIHRDADQRIPGHSHDHGIGPAPLRLAMKNLDNILPRIKWMVEAKLCRNRVTLREKVRSENPRPRALRERSQQNPDRPLADDQHSFIRLQLQIADRLVARVHRLNPRGLLKRNVLWNAHEAVLHNPLCHANVLREAATRRLEPGRRPHLLIHSALRESFFPAVVACAARNVMKRHHAVARLVIAHSLTDRDNRPRHLVPENPRRRMRPRMNLLQVGPADAARMNADQHLAATNRRHRHRLQSNIILPAIHNRTHRRRHREP